MIIITYEQFANTRNLYTKEQNYIYNSICLYNKYFKGIKVKYIGGSVGDLKKGMIFKVKGYPKEAGHSINLKWGTNMIELEGVKLLDNNVNVGLPDRLLAIADEDKKRFDLKTKRFNLKEDLIKNEKQVYYNYICDNIKYLKSPFKRTNLFEEVKNICIDSINREE